MQTRREFLTGTVAGLTTATLSPMALAANSAPVLGAELYTVRKPIQKDLPNTLAAVRKIGYRTVEAYGDLYKMSAADLRKAILDAGLSVPSGHFGYEDFDTRFDYAKELGLRYMICSSVPESLGNSADGFKRAADQYEAWGKKAQQMGMQFGFHNHNTEFQSYGGMTGIEILLKNTDPHLVQWQMDCYWVAEAGQSPAAMLLKYPGRITTLHLKDRKAGVPVSVEPGPQSAHFTEVGTGTLNWKKILPLAKKEGVRYMFVEQDITELPPLQSLKISYDNIQKLLQ